MNMDCFCLSNSAVHFPSCGKTNDKILFLNHNKVHLANYTPSGNINQTAAKSQGCAQDPGVPTPPKLLAPASKVPTPPASPPLPNATAYTTILMELTCLAPATTSTSFLDTVSPTTSTVAMELTQPLNIMIHT